MEESARVRLAPTTAVKPLILAIETVTAFFLLGLGIWWLKEDEGLEATFALISAVFPVLDLARRLSSDPVFVHSEVRANLQRLRSRIAREQSNFRHLVDGKPYSGAAHKRAVEETSFALLEVDLGLVASFRPIKRNCRRVHRLLQGIVSGRRENLPRFLDALKALDSVVEEILANGVSSSK